MFFLMLYDSVYKLKIVRKTFLVLTVLKNYEYLNELQGAMSLLTQRNMNAQ